MESLTGHQKEVLMYFRESLNHNVERGVKASEAANNIDAPMQDVIAACEQLDQLGLLDIEKRNMAGGKAMDLEAHITALGIDYLRKDRGIPL